MHTAVEWHPTRHSQSILQIVDAIYAAACGETPWQRTVARIGQVGRLDGCALSVLDPHERRRVALASWGLSSAAKPDAMLGHLLERILQSTPGAVWQDFRFRSQALSATLTGAGRRHPDGLSGACLVVGRDQRRVICLEAYAAAGRASSCPALDDFLRQLAPHLTRAWRLGNARQATPATPLSAAPLARSHADAAPRPDLAALPGMVRLRAEFGLTKAEARLALRLAEGSSLASAAQAFDVKLTTIRSQLQQVFAKTGTSRQTELVAMLLSRGYGSRGPLWSPTMRERPAAAFADAAL